MNNQFNINRFLLVLKRDIFENFKTALFGILTILSILSFILLMTTFASESDSHLLNITWPKFYHIGFWVTGILISGMAFSDFRNKEKTMSYLMIPATSLEKFLSILLLVTVGFVLVYTSVFGVFNLLNSLIISSISDSLSLAFFNPFNSYVWITIAVFIPIQSVFLAGAATFQKIPIFYTALYFFIFMLIYGAIAFILIRYYTGGLSFTGIGDNDNIVFSSTNGLPSEMSIENISSIKAFKFFFTYLLAPIFWVVAWFKLKEKEV